MAKRVSARKIKFHNQYTYEQAADALGVSVQTVRLWRLAGLQVLDGQKPHLILGFALKGFLNDRANKPECRLARDQFLCMTCHGARRAYGGLADYLPYSATRGRLEALCEVCQGPCGKFASPRLCAELAPILTIAIRNRKGALKEPFKPIANHNFRHPLNQTKVMGKTGPKPAIRRTKSNDQIP